jgi:hypothetical protein
MKRVRIQRPKVRPDHPWRAVLPLDPRDSRVLRAKALGRPANSHEEVTRK